MKKISILIIFLIVLTCFTGCGSSSEEGGSPTNLVVVALNGKNMPAVDVSVLEKDISEAAMIDQSEVSFVVCDGSPFLAETVEFGEREAKNSVFWENELSKRIKSAQNIFTETANTAEVDLIGALQLASRQLQTDKGAQRKLIIMASGLSTAGALQMQDLDNLSKLPDISSGILKNNTIDLDECIVSWYFLGDVAGDQPKLSTSQITALKSFWENLLLNFGAKSIDFPSDLPTTQEITTAPPVSVINVDDNRPSFSLGSETVSFKSDSYVIDNIDQTKINLYSLANIVISSGEKYILAGSTADTESGTEESAQTFSLERAASVKQLLLDLNVPENQLEIIGLGNKKTSVRSNNDQENRVVWLVPKRSDLGREFESIGLKETY